MAELEAAWREAVWIQVAVRPTATHRQSYDRETVVLIRPPDRSRSTPLRWTGKATMSLSFGDYVA